MLPRRDWPELKSGATLYRKSFVAVLEGMQGQPAIRYAKCPSRVSVRNLPELLNGHEAH